jgi:hypothetical protein
MTVYRSSPCHHSRLAATHPAEAGQPSQNSSHRSSSLAIAIAAAAQPSHDRSSSRSATQQPTKMNYQLHCILAHIGFPEHKCLAVSSVCRTCEDVKDIFCVYAGNRTAVHICLYHDFAVILDADELQLVLTVYDWFMDSISNSKFDWTIHPASNVPPTITGTIITTTTSKTTVIAKSDIPTESTIPTEYHTTTLVLPILRFLLKTLPTTFHTITKVHSIITNHQIFPLQ